MTDNTQAPQPAANSGGAKHHNPNKKPLERQGDSAATTAATIAGWLEINAVQRAALPIVADTTAALINATTVQTLLAVATAIRAGEYKTGGTQQ